MSGTWSKATLGSAPLQDGFSQAPGDPLQNQHSLYALHASEALCFLSTKQQLLLALHSSQSPLTGIAGPQTWLSGGLLTLPRDTHFSPYDKFTPSSPVLRNGPRKPSPLHCLILEKELSSLLFLACPGAWKLKAWESGGQSPYGLGY